MASYVDLDRTIAVLRRGDQLLEERQVASLCQRARLVLSREPNVLRINAPVTICGDVHGQFYDVREIFRVAGDVPDTNYLFLGDYIDRGAYCVETLLLLFALKLRYPDRIGLLRGNHEAREPTKSYGFYDECMRKYRSPLVWQWFMQACDCLSLAAVIDQEVAVYCVHAGLSPRLQTIEQIEQVERRVEVDPDSPLSDLLWSDPEDFTDPYEYDQPPVERLDIGDGQSWGVSPRGAGYLFGPAAVRQFLDANACSLVCRSHQLVMEGFRWHFDKTLVTVWSAPNYCYRSGNVAAIVEVDEQLSTEFIVFDAAPDNCRGKRVQATLPDYFL